MKILTFEENKIYLSMKKFLVPAIIIVIVGLLAWWLFGGSYNTMISKQEKINEAWSNVETQYQRRTDLYNSVVETIKGSAEFERGTLTDVIKARKQVSDIKLDADDLTPENLARFQKAQSQLSSAFSRLLVTVERYPELKTTGAFREFQVQIEGTENRINKARNDFNAIAREYNTYIKKFPRNIVAGLFGFNERPYFEAAEGTEKAPEINF